MGGGRCASEQLSALSDMRNDALSSHTRNRHRPRSRIQPATQVAAALRQERIIRREVITTVARQLDSPKRVRDARQFLAAFDVIILGHQGNDPTTAKQFGLPVPKKGEWISVTTALATPTDHGAALVDGEWRKRLFTAPTTEIE